MGVFDSAEIVPEKPAARHYGHHRDDRSWEKTSACFGGPAGLFRALLGRLQAARRLTRQRKDAEAGRHRKTADAVARNQWLSSGPRPRASADNPRALHLGLAQPARGRRPGKPGALGA